MRAIGGAHSGAIHSFWGTLLGLQAFIALSVTGASPEIEVGNATTLPAPVPEPEDADKPLEPKTPAAPAPQEETTPLQDYATYEATKDISDPNTAAVAGAAAAQVAGALQ